MILLYKNEALKQLKRIGTTDLPKVKRKIQVIKDNPLVGKHLHGEHSGQFCVRAWPLRIIYTFDSSSQTIEIITVDYRGQVYK